MVFLMKTRFSRVAAAGIASHPRSVRATLRACTIAAGLAAGLLSGGGALAAQPAEWVKGRVIVQARAGLADAEVAKIARGHGGSARRIGGTDLHIVTLPGNRSETAVQAVLAHHPQLKFAELDGIVRPSLAVNDPYAGSAWHLNKIGAPTAWDVSQGSGITIAILDTGVDVTHPDLAGRTVAGWNFYNNTADITDAASHGTSVAGAAAASTNNGLGVAGIAGQTRIMPLRISSETGSASWSAMAQALVHAADQGVRVANISYMVGGVSTVQSAAQYMKSKGGLVFVSGGNYGTLLTDAPTTTMIPVSATDTNDGKPSWSSYGPIIALAAPGTGIYSTLKGGGYGAVSGTSYASPVAAGVAAAVMAANPALSAAQVESILFTTARDLGAAGRDDVFGHGRVDAAAAVQKALATAAADTTAPSVAVTSPTAAVTVSGLVAVNVAAADNIGVTRVDLLVNGSVVASDVVTPFGFSWDSTSVADGMAAVSARAYDGAGNLATSSSVSVNVSNGTLSKVTPDTTPPVVTIRNPLAGARVSGTVSISASASDNSGPAGITQVLQIDGRQVASTTGSTLSYSWNTRKVAAGSHTISVTATDAAGNRTTTAVSVTR